MEVGSWSGKPCEIGDHVTIFQGVTLGGTGKEKGKRHPTIEIMCSSPQEQKCLGPLPSGDTRKLAHGSVVLHDVPDNSTVVGIPGRIVKQNGVKIIHEPDHDLPDPLSDKLKQMEPEIDRLQDEIRILKKKGETTIVTMKFIIR